MSDIDEKKPTGKAGKRKRHADQRNRKADQKQPPKPDQQHAAKPQAGSVLMASTATAPIPAKAAKTRPGTTQPSPIIAAVEPVPIALQASQVQADTAILAVEAVAAPVASVPSAVPMATAPAAVPAPVAAQTVREPLAAPTTTSVETPVIMAPIARPKLVKQTVGSTAAPTSAEAAPVPATDMSVSLQTIAQAYGEYTRKSLEQTKCFFDKLTSVRSLEQAVEIQTEFAKQACETFVAEAQKIHELHRELARQRFERLEGLMTMGAQASC